MSEGDHLLSAAVAAPQYPVQRYSKPAQSKNGAETFVVLCFIVRKARFFTPLLHPAFRVSKHSLDGPAGTPSPKTGPLILCNLLN